MSNTLKLRCLLIFSLFSFSRVHAQADTTQIRTAFRMLKTALIEEDSKTVIALADSVSLRFYSRMYRMAKTADSVEVEKLPMFEKAFVFAIRVRGQQGGLARMSDSAFFRYAVENSMVDKMGMPLSGGELGTITVEGTKASAAFLVFNTAIPNPVFFHKQRGRWKADLTSLILVSNELFKNMAAGQNQSETQFLLSMLRQSGKGESLNSVWQPLKK